MIDLLKCPIRNRKPRGQGPSRRGEILAAATRIFLQEGVAGATMRRIAAEVGFSATALYVYFPDKEAILAAIAEAWFAELLAVLQTSQIAPEGVEAKFRAGLRACIEFGLAKPDGYRLTFLARPAHRPTGEACEKIPEADRSFGILLNSVTEMMREGRFRQDDPAKIAETIWGALHGLTILLLDQTDHLQTPRETLIATMLDALVQGFAPTPHGVLQ